MVTKDKGKKEVKGKKVTKDKKKSEVKHSNKNELKPKKKKEESYFMALLKKSNLLFTSWKIDTPKWKKKIETAEADHEGRDYLFINISSIDNNDLLYSIPVHGLENNWHIFIRKDYTGKRIILSLAFRDKKGKFSDILKSREIDVPLSLEDVEAGQPGQDAGKTLLELSEVRLSVAGSDSTSW